MRSLLWVLQKLNIIINWDTTVESSASNLLEVLCESVKFLLDLIGELSGVAKNNCGGWFWISLVNLVKDGEDEHGSLTHAGDSLAENVFSRNCGWDALLLHFRWMLKTAFCDCSRKLRLQEEVSERSGVDSSIGSHPK
jgi:hypothetical protein